MELERWKMVVGGRKEEGRERNGEEKEKEEIFMPGGEGGRRSGFTRRCAIHTHQCADA